MSLVDLGKKLLESARIGETDDVRLLMSNGAPFTTDWLGASPLHLASQHGHLETVAVLIRAGICRDARTKLDRTSLHLASQEGQVQIVELLLKSGADIEAKDMLKMTPLHWAVEREHLPTVEILLRHNADVNVKNKFDKTPLDISFDNNQTEIYELLQKYAVLKENELLKSDKLDLDHLPSSDSTEIVTTSFVEVNKSSKNSFHNLKSKSPRKYITVPKLSPEENDEIKRSVSSLKLIQKGCSDNESNDLQTSTSVLDTLAALAEATASKSDTSIEGANWLEENGITMLPVDNSTVVTSALEGGQSLTLTEAGKLALNWTKSKPNGRDISTNSSTNEKVITIVADQSQIPSIVGSSNQGTPILLMNTDGSETVTFTNTDEISNPVKRPRLARKISLKSPKILESKEDILSEKEKLQRELEETRKMAEEYKAKLIKKENEAEEYKKKLDEISSPK